MSRASFPRPEHSALLREKIAERLRSHPVPLEVGARSLDQYRCCYRFGFRESPDQDWVELSIHFQVAERLESNPGSGELDKLLDLFLNRHFSMASPES
ncbi:MAG: hypothetical protein HY316_07240 [Acidobacteria bacterium]|nr:hypothetical protein [Acidobacteriota bacterium]